jgi:hypothetical protein
MPLISLMDRDLFDLSLLPYRLLPGGEPLYYGLRLRIVPTPIHATR